MISTTYAEDINQALHHLLQTDDRVYVMGEDILDPYGGAFRVTKGLSTAFPGRLLPTPISEASIAGIAGGMALRGFRPVVEIMFGDFITLCADQIVNHLCKFAAMYNGQVICPVVIRTPMGGGRGYGPTHSQTLERLFLGIPHLTILAPSHFHSPGQLLQEAALQSVQPVLFIENKLLYPMSLRTLSSGDLSLDYEGEGSFPVAHVKNYSQGDPDVVIIAYGGGSRILEDVLRNMFMEEIKVFSCLPSSINDMAFIGRRLLSSIGKAGRVVVLEEGPEGFGWGGEVVSTIYRHVGVGPVKVVRHSALPTVIPAARHLEEAVLPSVESLEAALMRVLE